MSHETCVRQELITLDSRQPRHIATSGFREAWHAALTETRFLLGRPDPGRHADDLSRTTAELGTELSDMCARAGIAGDTATQALLQADLALAENVIAGHDHLTAVRTRVEETPWSSSRCKHP